MILPAGKKYGAIYADPAWTFKCWSGKGKARSAENHYETMTPDQIKAIPVESVAADDCCLFLWVTCPQLLEGLAVMEAWGFTYKTKAFSWMKQNEKAGHRPPPERNPQDLLTGMGYWTRANTEDCLLGVRGKPKRLNADVKQPILEPVREHSRKPDCVPARIERLVAGPYLEMFARTSRPGWDCVGNESDKFTVV